MLRIAESRNGGNLPPLGLNGQLDPRESWGQGGGGAWQRAATWRDAATFREAAKQQGRDTPSTDPPGL